jgi:hypothetical protein
MLLIGFAAQYHATRGEMPPIGVNAVFAGLTILAAWGQPKKGSDYKTRLRQY